MQNPQLFRLAAGAALVASAVALRLPAAGATLASGDLIRASQPAVYYYGDGKRYVFPNEATYKTWYDDFTGVKTVTDDELAAIPIGGNVTYRPGTRMVKIVSDPKAYAVDAGGTLRHVASEAVARALFGDAWATKIDDVADAFFTNYRTGSPIVAIGDFDPGAVRSAVASIAADKGLSTAANAPTSVSASIDLTKLPLGDGKYSTTAKKGYVYSCQTSFTGSGAFTDGPWISGSTWNATIKATVDGSVSWPSAAFAIGTSGTTRTFTTNDLPKGHATGTFPIASTDDAYSYDRNPNSIKAQSMSFSVPLDPVVAVTPSCVGGEVGIATSGVMIFNGFDAGGRDAVAHEVQDACDGHPQEAGAYHYHGPSSCVATGDGELFGYAFDGFGIYSMLEKGKTVTNADLDECHGHTGEVLWNGAKKTMYHYHLTNEFPYTVGCFKGTPTRVQPTGGTSQGGQQAGPGGMGGYPPPPRY